MNQQDLFELAANHLLAQLKELGSDYLLINRKSDQNINIKFLGKFKQQTIVWDAYIRTVHYYYEFEQFAVNVVEIRQSIDIEKKEDCYKINLVLNLNKIDESAIQKSIIMVRNYKRLSLGRHEYGEEHLFYKNKDRLNNDQ